MMHTSWFAGRYPDRSYVKECRRDGKRTLVLLHGGSHSGVCYEHTPDGRLGWEPHFVRKGHSVYTVEWPGIGRSGHHPEFLTMSGMQVVTAFRNVLEQIGESVVLVTHSMSGVYGWKLAEIAPGHIEQIVAVAPGPPGNIMDVEDTRFADLDSPFMFSEQEVQRSWANTRQFPKGCFEQYYSSLQPVSPRLLNERFNYDNSQLQVDPAKVDVDIHVLTGEDDPRHPREHDVSIVRFFQKRGVSAEHIWLPDHGFCGNGHMMMLEQNSLSIADFIHKELL